MHMQTSDFIQKYTRSSRKFLNRIISLSSDNDETVKIVQLNKCYYAYHGIKLWNQTMHNCHLKAYNRLDYNV